MLFKVLKSIGEIEPSNEDVVYLIKDDWNDWWKYCTLYQVYIGTNYIGSVKIGSDILVDKRPDLPKEFKVLDDQFYSLGQSENYYIELNKLVRYRSVYLQSLKDIAYDVNHYNNVKNKHIVIKSLMREISKISVEGRLRRLAHGDAKLTEFNFSYKFKDCNLGAIDFHVQPENLPPSNVHVLIGKNGVGKSFFLNKMLDSLVKNETNEPYGEFENLEEEGKEIFSKVISVSFSAFDDYNPNEATNDIAYTYLGLKEITKKKDISKKAQPKSPNSLSNEFAEVIYKCHINGKIDLWQNLLKDLQYDSSFDKPDITNLLSFENFYSDESEIKSKAAIAFNTLSSGHKVVLLTLASLIQNVEERTLVLMDEPETYLHPPLISAFIQVISKLLRKRNGVAIITTHSPVILQEVPKKCVWKIRKEGTEYSFKRPKIETFWENLGLLNREIFGLEMAQTGFHKIIIDAVKNLKNYDKVLEHFNNELGEEAKNLVLALSEDEGDFE